MHFCQDLFYGRKSHADIMMIHGTCWDLQLGMSPEAERHLVNALRFFKEKVRPDIESV